MSLTPDQMDLKMDEHFGFEATDDVEGVLATLTADADHDIVGWPGGPTKGRENARPFYETLFADIEDSTVTRVKRLYGDNFLVDESYVEGTAAGMPYGLEGRGRRVGFRILHVIEYSDEGLMKRENVWIDLSALIQQLPQD